MKKSLSLFLTLTMAMVLSVSAPSVVCAGTATSKAYIEQGKIKPENIYIKSDELPAFDLGNMKAADMVALTKYAEGGSPQFHELNAKTHVWMNSERINTVNRYKTDYEIAQEALAFQKNKLKKPYQDKIDEAARKRDEALAELERKKNGEFTDEEVFEYCQKRAQEQAEGTDMEGVPAQPTAMCLGDYGRREMQEQAEAEYEDKKREIEEQYENEVAVPQSKINEIDAAKDAEALGKVKANQDQDVAKKREEAAQKQAEASQKEKKAEAAEAAVKEAEDKLSAICPEGSGVKTTCEQKNAQAIADAQEELEKARSDAATAKQAAEEARAEADKAKTAADAADTAEKKIVDDLKNENERIKGILERQDRYGVQEETAAFSEVADVDEHVSQAKQEYYDRNAAKIAKEKEEKIKAYQDAAIKEYEKNYKYLMEQGHYAAYSVGQELEQLKKGEGIAFEQLKQNAISTVDANYSAAWEQEEATLRSNLQSERDNALSLRDELAEKTKSSADASGVKFGGLGSGEAASIQAEKNKLFLPSDKGVDDISSGKSN